MKNKLEIKEDLREQMSSLFPAEKHQHVLVSLFLARDKRFKSFLDSIGRIPAYLLYVLYNVNEDFVSGILYYPVKLGLDEEDCKVAIKFLELLYGDKNYVPTNDKPLSDTLSKKVSERSWATLYELQSYEQLLNMNYIPNCLGSDNCIKLFNYLGYL